MHKYPKPKYKIGDIVIYQDYEKTRDENSELETWVMSKITKAYTLGWKKQALKDNPDFGKDSNHEWMYSTEDIDERGWDHLNESEIKEKLELLTNN